MKSIEGLSEEEERAAAMFRALGSPARVRIVAELARRNACVTSDLVDVLPLAQSTVSQHLKVLKEAGIIRGEVDGEPCYCLDQEALAWIMRFCEQVCGPGGCETIAPLIEEPEIPARARRPTRTPADVAKSEVRRLRPLMPWRSAGTVRLRLRRRAARHEGNPRPGRCGDAAPATVNSCGVEATAAGATGRAGDPRPGRGRRFHG
ncbi:MAG: metalloregulator ArsR/SmtB family transcription factor [Dehalococcoidia bacterium]|nr:metalloregulator ArsR/SmtB family transcription factor [Dehalococcoidia bacterium]